MITVVIESNNVNQIAIGPSKDLIVMQIMQPSMFRSFPGDDTLYMVSSYLPCPHNLNKLVIHEDYQGVGYCVGVIKLGMLDIHK